MGVPTIQDVIPGSRGDFPKLPIWIMDREGSVDSGLLRQASFDIQFQWYLVFFCCGTDSFGCFGTFVAPRGSCANKKMG